MGQDRHYRVMETQNMDGQQMDSLSTLRRSTVETMNMITRPHGGYLKKSMKIKWHG
jgi:hypothetical protein